MQCYVPYSAPAADVARLFGIAGACVRRLELEELDDGEVRIVPPSPITERHLAGTGAESRGLLDRRSSEDSDFATDAVPLGGELEAHLVSLQSPARMDQERGSDAERKGLLEFEATSDSQMVRIATSDSEDRLLSADVVELTSPAWAGRGHDLSNSRIVSAPMESSEDLAALAGESPRPGSPGKVWRSHARKATAALDTRRSVRGSMMLLVLGSCPGLVLSFYFASIGYHARRLQDPSLFGYQTLVAMTVQFSTIMMQRLVDEYQDRQFGFSATFGARIMFPGLGLCVAMLFVPFCVSANQVLAVGACISCLATVQLASATQLGAVLVPGGGQFVAAGNTLGGALTAAAVPLMHFSPKASEMQALRFYAVASVFSLVCMLIFACLHVDAAGKAHDQRWVPAKRGQTLDRLPLAYQMMSGRNLESPRPELLLSPASAAVKELGLDELSATPRVNWSRDYVEAVAGIAVMVASDSLVGPLFTLAGPHVAQNFVLSKMIGGAIGRLVGLWHCTVCGVRGYVGRCLRRSLLVLVVLRCVLIGVIVFWLLGRGHLRLLSWPLPAWAACAGSGIVYMSGAYGGAMLDLDPQLAVEKTQRGPVSRTNMLVCFGFVFIGVLAGMPLRREAVHA